MVAAAFTSENALSRVGLSNRPTKHLHIVDRNVKYVGRHMEKIQGFGRDSKLSTMAATFTVVKRVERLLRSILDLALADA